MPRVELEKPYASWSFLNLRTKKGLEELNRLLRKGQELSLSSDSVLTHILNPPKGRKRPLCQTVLVENSYFDQDFVHSVSSFYSKGFRDTSRFCIRLHFFSCKVNAFDVPQPGALEKLQEHYLGFCVVRPLTGKKLGRTVLKPRRDTPGSEFHTCCGRFDVNIAGEELFVNAAPFMEQDSRVQTCSSIAIWISTTVIARCFGYPEYTTSEIMSTATRILVGARAGPTQGLTYEQMMQALCDMGYQPIIFDEADRSHAVHDIYSYVESSIPPILLLALQDGNHHAVVVLGHAHSRPLQPGASQISISLMGQSILKYFRSSEWVPHFYVHDDQRGTYRHMSFIDPDPRQLAQRIRRNHAGTLFPPMIAVDLTKWHCPVAISTESTLARIPRETIANIWGIIVPLPTGITLSHIEAEKKAAQIIRRCADRLRLKLPDDLVIRAYLIPSNIYKSRLGEHPHIHPFTKALYRAKPMPKWLWMIEMSTATLMNAANVDDIRIRGELILDATSNPQPIDFLTFHWIDDADTGNIFTMTQEDSDIDDALVSYWWGPAQAYQPMIR